MKNVLGAFTRFLAQITRNPIGMAGAVLTTISAVLFVTLFALELVGFHGGPYLGILAFLIIPGIFVFGLLLIPVGLWRDRVRHRRLLAAGADDQLPVWNLNVDRVRRNFLIFVTLSAVNLMILVVGDLQGRRGDGLDAVLRDGLPQGDAPGVHDLPALAARAGEVRGVPHRRGRRLVRQVEAVRLLAARVRGLQPLPAADRRPRPQPAARARDLRAVPLAAEVRGRPLQGEHALPGGRGQHRDEDGAGGQGRRTPGRPQPGHPLARRSRPRGPLPLGREAPDDLRGRDDGRGRDAAALRRTERRDAGGQAGDRVAAHGLRRLPQSPDAHLPLAGAGARQRAARQADRHGPALHPARGPQGAQHASTRRPRPRAPASRRRSPTSTGRATRR